MEKSQNAGTKSAFKPKKIINFWFFFPSFQYQTHALPLFLSFRRTLCPYPFHSSVSASAHPTSKFLSLSLSLQTQT